MILNVDTNPKSLLEALCVAESAIIRSPTSAEYKALFLPAIRQLMDECERMRPVGPDGKHGNRHTDECGCEDK
jgi:hypothetical protein